MKPEHSSQIDENAPRLPGLSRAQGTEQMPTVWEQDGKQTGTTTCRRWKVLGRCAQLILSQWERS